jgi:hypothetical protein
VTDRDKAITIRARLIDEAGNRCGDCRAHQQYVYETLHIEHIEPRACGGGNDEEFRRLWVALGPHPRGKMSRGLDMPLRMG